MFVKCIQEDAAMPFLKGSYYEFDTSGGVLLDGNGRTFLSCPDMTSVDILNIVFQESDSHCHFIPVRTTEAYVRSNRGSLLRVCLAP